MPRKKASPAADAREQELQTLRAQVAQLSLAASSHVGRMQQMSQGGIMTDNVWVGIRSVADNTIGIPGKFGQPDIHLHAALGHHDPACVVAIPYAWWLQLRKSKWIRDGLFIRDDSVLGQGFSAAPPDLPDDLPADGYQVNIIEDPEQWILSRTEQQIRNDISRITSEASLRRIRRGVDVVLKRMQDSYGNEVENKAGKAWSDISVLFRLVDELTTHRLERPEDFAPTRR